MSGKDDATDSRRHQTPYSAKHPIPTIGKYRAEKAEREKGTVSGEVDLQDDTAQATQYAGADQPSTDGGQQQGDDGAPKDTSEIGAGSSDPKQRRKEMKGQNDQRAQREVTDPITHLPVAIHDFTDKALDDVEPNPPAFGLTKKTATGMSGKQKSNEQLRNESNHAQEAHGTLAHRFPPPDFDALRKEVANISKRAITFGLSGVAVILLGMRALQWLTRRDKSSDASRGFDYTGTAVWLGLSAVTVAATYGLIIGVRDWTANKINNVFQDEVWDAHRQQIKDDAGKHDTETTAWLNSLLGSVWPLINPDLFTGVADMLEDVMQASLPKFIRMVSVDDIGQGSEALRILGVRWLPTGAAMKSVTEDGSLSSDDVTDGGKDGSPPDQDQTENGEKKDGDGKTISAGLEAEEGDFVNLEVAFAYRTRSTSKTLKERTKDMHLYLAFYLPGNIKVPVWVDLQGIIGTMRMRLQLTPDPPFFALCTLTFLGQPKVNVSCVPLNKSGLNIMDVPFISNFVQSAVDAAMAEYVAPKSLTIDLKDMLAGDDFKKDTNATGVLMINMKRGYDFKIADTGIPLIKDGSSDPYVSVGWAKFGKVLWSTRILKSEMEPYWDETCFVLVTPEELNVDERLRVQLWDSDRMTADDDLGRIEVDLKQVMKSEESNGKMSNRQDSFRALKSGDNMPGKLEWSIGYFSKTRIQKGQFEQQTHDPKVRTMEQLKEKVDESCERKLRETMFKEGQNKRDESELEQQKTQELKAEQDAMIISAPPPEGYPSGLFSLQIHNITGLELEQLSKSQSDKEAVGSEEEEAGDGLPSAYCTVIVNHRNTFKTRTKPQNAKPFYNAGCERFIRDWRDCEVYVAVRDARLHEDDPLLGIVHLPLNEIFKDRAQVNGFWPLAGGIGHGRIRLSMVWRSVQLQAPENLIGWDYGTVQVKPTAVSTDCPDKIKSLTMKLKTNISAGKMYASSDKNEWHTKKDQDLILAVKDRYSSCLSIAFKQKGVTGDSIAAFCVLWLKDIPDEEDQDLELPIWQGDFKRATASALPEGGEKVGTLKLKATFWAGMGSAHSKWAASNQNLRDVVEVIDTARDNVDDEKMQKKAGIVDEEVSSDSDSSSDEDGEDGDIPDGSANNKQGPIDQVKSYKKRDKALHRQHRGMMQWKIPRTAKWMKHKFEKVGDNVSEVFDHRGKGAPTIETEV